jgi:hypothetical protein
MMNFDPMLFGIAAGSNFAIEYLREFAKKSENNLVVNHGSEGKSTDEKAES